MRFRLCWAFTFQLKSLRSPPWFRDWSPVSLFVLPWPKRSLQPRYSWDWSAVRSCDIVRHRLRSSTSECKLQRELAMRSCRGSRRCRTEARYHTISQDRTVDQPHEFLGCNDFFGQGSRSTADSSSRCPRTIAEAGRGFWLCTCSKESTSFKKICKAQSTKMIVVNHSAHTSGCFVLCDWQIFCYRICRLQQLCV